MFGEKHDHEDTFFLVYNSRARKYKYNLIEVESKRVFDILPNMIFKTHKYETKEDALKDLDFALNHSVGKPINIKKTEVEKEFKVKFIRHTNTNSKSF